MTQTRIYVPLDPAGVRQLAAEHSVGQPGMAAFAVTERVERAEPTGDEEDWEYAALTEAVEAAGELRRELGKRIVAAADVEPSWVSDAGSSLASVRLSSPVPLSRVVAFHVDESAQDEGMEDLLWYDATELDEVLRLI